MIFFEMSQKNLIFKMRVQESNEYKNEFKKSINVQISIN